VHERASLHGDIRKQYSALRVMMNLLKLRSDREKRSFSAEVVESHEIDQELNDTMPAYHGEPEMEHRKLRVRISSQSVRDVIEEDMLVELETENWKRMRKARVLVVSHRAHDTIIEFDLSSEGYNLGDEVQVNVVSRFGMWGNQRAVYHLLDERVHGYWPDLAKTLTKPESLDIPVEITYPGFYFCDLEPDRPSLNDRQRAAVAGAIATPHMFCIQGPPGTGKTTVICELVQQLIAKGERILLAASTHVAVDEVLRRIEFRASYVWRHICQGT